METNYLKQATDFLTKVGATVKIKFLKYDKHFRDDKDCRNMYRVTIRKDGKSMSLILVIVSVQQMKVQSRMSMTYWLALRNMK